MEESAVQELFKKFWNWRMKEFPEFATFTGEHTHDDNLQSYALESIENRQLDVMKYLEEASSLLHHSNIKNEEAINLACFINQLSIFLKGHTAKGYFFPLSYLDGVHIEFERLLDCMKKEVEADYLKILSRLSLLPRQISEIIELMREGIKNKMTFHLISVSGILQQIDALQLKPEETIFYKPFRTIPDDVSFSTNSKTEILTKAKTIIAENVLPAFKELRSFLENEYFKHLRPEIAISSLNGGKEYYNSCLDYHLSCSMTPKEVHEMGLKEVEKIRFKMEENIIALELNMSVKEFSEHLRKQTDFCFQNVEELLETYRGVMFNRIKPKLPQLFNFIPKTELCIDVFPSSTPNHPAAFYFAGPSDGSRPGTFFINAANLNDKPKYDVMALALHEGMPGHHLHMSYLIENQNMPQFRKFFEDRRYTEAPSLFPLYTSHIEGWGLYCESLGYELGLYDDNYLKHGQLSFDMLRACRLVVDTGIHALGWTREKAIDYILEHTPMHRSGVEKEVDRYITWPGQACAYKIGDLKIKAFREQAEKALGSKFDVCEFHDVVLRSTGSLELLEQRILDYIQQNNS